MEIQKIVDHEGPLSDYHSNYKGSSYIVIFEWETGETPTETLSISIPEEPVTCALYDYYNNLLQQEW